MSDTIVCRSCRTIVPALATICSNPHCARNPRDEPHQEVEAVDGPAAEGPPATGILGPPVGSTSGTVIVTLPNFDEVIIQPGGTLLLGRESAIEPVAAALAPYGDVGRAHCVIRNTDDGIVIEARGDGRQIAVESVDVSLADGQRAPVHAGQRIRLGLACHVKVDFEKEGSRR